MQRATSPIIPSLSRSGTILLELKRRYVSQRLNELRATLGQMRQSQQPDSKSGDRTRAYTQSDSSTNQQGEIECYPGANGCSPTDVQQGHNISSGRSHSPHCAASRHPDNPKLASHISDQQQGATVHSNNTDALQDSLMVESQLQGSAPGNS